MSDKKVQHLLDSVSKIIIHTINILNKETIKDIVTTLINVRVKPEIHRKLSKKALEEGITLNAMIVKSA